MTTDPRREARGHECCVRIPGICNGNRETVVLAHLNNKRLFGVGVGQKVPDFFGARCCSACHDAYDQRTALGKCPEGFSYSYPEIRELFMEGVFRTQKILLDEGKI